MVTEPHRRYAIDRARPGDLVRLGEIERAAVQLLSGHLPERMLAESTDPACLNAAQRRGRLWVARSDEIPVGFAYVELLEPDVAHLAELHVHPDHGRRGLGRRLVRAVCAWATASRYEAVTLTTFRDLPWNGPFYARMGFEQVLPAELSPALHAVLMYEAAEGIDPAQRVAMRWPVTLSVHSTPAAALAPDDR